MILDESRIRELIRESLIMTEIRQSLRGSTIREELESEIGVGAKTRELYISPASVGRGRRRGQEDYDADMIPYIVLRPGTPAATQARNRLSNFHEPYSGFVYNSLYPIMPEELTQSVEDVPEGEGCCDLSDSPSTDGFGLLSERPASAGRYSIGYGHFIDNDEWDYYKQYIKPGDLQGRDPLQINTIGESEKESLLDSDMIRVGESIKSDLLEWSETIDEEYRLSVMSQDMFDALVSVFKDFYVSGEIDVFPGASEWLRDASGGGGAPFVRLMKAAVDIRKVRKIKSDNMILSIPTNRHKPSSRARRDYEQRLWNLGWEHFSSSLEGLSGKDEVPSDLIGPMPSETYQNLTSGDSVAPISVLGHVDKSRIQHIVRSNLEQIHSCNTGGYSGKVGIKITIGATGRVESSDAYMWDNPRSLDLEDCITQLLSRITFPVSRGKTIVKYPFEFSDLCDEDPSLPGCQQGDEEDCPPGESRDRAGSCS